jgi:hypothetical protein
MELFLEAAEVVEVRILQQTQNKVDRLCTVEGEGQVEATDRVEVYLVVSVELLFLPERVVQVLLDQ